MICKAIEDRAYGLFCELIKTKIEYAMCVEANLKVLDYINRKIFHE